MVDSARHLLFVSFFPALFAGCSRPTASLRADFPRVSGSVRPADLHGPFTGRVVDAGTGRAIAGATVLGVWVLREVPGVGAISGYRRILVHTDLSGRYRIPSIRTLRGPRWSFLRRDGHVVPVAGRHGPGGRGRIAAFRLLVYKPGYVAYRSDRLFETGEPRRDFVQFDNLVTLRRWSANLRHLDHLRFLAVPEILGQAGRRELLLAERELHGATAPSQKRRQSRARTTATLPDLSTLVTSSDLRILYGAKGVYERGRLTSLPASRNADSIHLKAVGRDESYDFAIRVWRYAPRRAELEFARMLQTYPHAKRVDKLADASFQAANARVLGHVFLMRHWGLVVSVTCGRNLCQSHEGLLRACRLVEYRLGKLLHGAGGPNPDKFRRGPMTPKLER